MTAQMPSVVAACAVTVIMRLITVMLIERTTIVSLCLSGHRRMPFPGETQQWCEYNRKALQGQE